MNTNNQFNSSPYQYDAAGNMTHDGSHIYYYDAENHLIQIDGTFEHLLHGDGLLRV